MFVRFISGCLTLSLVFDLVANPYLSLPQPHNQKAKVLAPLSTIQTIAEDLSLMDYLENETVKPFVDPDDASWSKVLRGLNSDEWLVRLEALKVLYLFAFVINHKNLKEKVLDSILEVLTENEFEAQIENLFLDEFFWERMRVERDIESFLEKTEQRVSQTENIVFKVRGLDALTKACMVLGDAEQAEKIYLHALGVLKGFKDNMFSLVFSRSPFLSTVLRVAIGTGLLFLSNHFVIAYSLFAFSPGMTLIVGLSKVLFFILASISALTFPFLYGKELSAIKGEFFEALEQITEFSKFEQGVGLYELFSSSRRDDGAVESSELAQEIRKVREAFLIHSTRKAFFEEQIRNLTPNEKIVYEKAKEIKGLHLGIDFDGTLIPLFESALLLDDLENERDVSPETKRFWERAAMPPGMKPFLLGFIEQNEMTIITAAGKKHVEGFPVWIPFLEKFIWMTEIEIKDRHDVLKTHVGELAFEEDESQEPTRYSINGVSLLPEEVYFWESRKQIKIPWILGVDMILEDNSQLGPLLERIYGKSFVIRLRHYGLQREEEQVHTVSGYLEYDDDDKGEKPFKNVKITTEEQYEAEVLSMLPIIEQIKQIQQSKEKSLLEEETSLIEQAV